MGRTSWKWRACAQVSGVGLAMGARCRTFLVDAEEVLALVEGPSEAIEVGFLAACTRQGGAGACHVRLGSIPQTLSREAAVRLVCAPVPATYLEPATPVWPRLRMSRTWRRAASPWRWNQHANRARFLPRALARGPASDRSKATVS